MVKPWSENEEPRRPTSGACSNGLADARLSPVQSASPMILEESTHKEHPCRHRPRVSRVCLPSGLVSPNSVVHSAPPLGSQDVFGTNWDFRHSMPSIAPIRSEGIFERYRDSMRKLWKSYKKATPGRAMMSGRLAQSSLCIRIQCDLGSANGSGEAMGSCAEFTRRCTGRLPAIAECGWSPSSEKLELLGSFSGFTDRILCYNRSRKRKPTPARRRP